MSKGSTNGLEASLMNASELTPISVKEAKKVLGESSEYSSGEHLAAAVLDFSRQSQEPTSDIYLR